jgi:hypothetical protein
MCAAGRTAGLAGAVKLFLDALDVDLIAIAVQRAAPRRGRFLTTADRPEQISEVILDDRVAGQLIRRLPQQRLSLVESLLLEVRPTQTIEIRTVAGIDRERSLDERNRLVEAIAALGGR